MPNDRKQMFEKKKIVCQKFVKNDCKKTIVVRRRSYGTKDRMPKDRMQKFVKKKMVCQTLVENVRKIGII